MAAAERARGVYTQAEHLWREHLLDDYDGCTRDLPRITEDLLSGVRHQGAALHRRLRQHAARVTRWSGSLPSPVFAGDFLEALAGITTEVEGLCAALEAHGARTGHSRWARARARRAAARFHRSVDTARRRVAQIPPGLPVYDDSAHPYASVWNIIYRGLLEELRASGPRALRAYLAVAGEYDAVAADALPALNALDDRELARRAMVIGVAVDTAAIPMPGPGLLALLVDADHTYGYLEATLRSARDPWEPGNQRDVNDAADAHAVALIMSRRAWPALGDDPMVFTRRMLHLALREPKPGEGRVTCARAYLWDDPQDLLEVSGLAWKKSTVVLFGATTDAYHTLCVIDGREVCLEWYLSPAGKRMNLGATTGKHACLGVVRRPALTAQPLASASALGGGPQVCVHPSGQWSWSETTRGAAAAQVATCGVCGAPGVAYRPVERMRPEQRAGDYPADEQGLLLAYNARRRLEGLAPLVTLPVPEGPTAQFTGGRNLDDTLFGEES